MNNIADLRYSIPILTKDNTEYISIVNFAYIFDGYLEKGDFFTKVIFTDRNKKVTFNHGSKEIFINEKKSYLQSPTLIVKKKLYIPFDFVKREWAEELNIDAEWKEEQAILTLNPPRKKRDKEEKKVKEETRKEEDIYGEKNFFYLQSEKTDSSHKKYSIKTITIDPGHGGRDPGAIGPTGVKEKDITLDIAKKVKRLIEAEIPEVRVILTRYFDEFISLKKRGDIANMNKSDLFISIHVNASFSRTAGGFETYYLSAQASDDMARAISALENGVISLEENAKSKDYGYTEFILADMAQNQSINESIELAGILQEIASRRLNIRSRGIKSALFYVLKDAVMPAILVEVAFISNPKEEKDVEKDYFRNQVAECITEAILEYKRRYE